MILSERKKRYLGVAMITAAVLFIAGVLLENYFPLLFFKPFRAFYKLSLTIFLTLIFLLSVWKDSRFKGSRIFFILFFVNCAIGDFFMAMGADSYLIYGLSFFVLAHFFYITGQLRLNLKGAVNRYSIIAFVVGTLTALVINYFIFPYLASPFRIIIPVYSFIVILMMALSVSNLANRIFPSFGKYLFALGGVLFFISDCLLAWKLFYPGARSYMVPIITLTPYYMALILIGLVPLQKDKCESKSK